MTRGARLALTLMLALAASASGVAAQADDVAALQEAGRRFLADYWPYLQDPAAHPQRAASLARDLPAVITIQQRRPDAQWLAALGSVAWHLITGGGDGAQAVLAQADALRAVLLDPLAPGPDPSLDEQLVSVLLAEGRWQQADALIDEALPTWTPRGLDTGLVLLRVDLRRKQERWGEALELLDQAEAGLPGQRTDLGCEAARLRGQLELVLGRLDLAARALQTAREQLAATVEARGADDPLCLDLAAATELLAVDLDLTAGRLEAVAARPAPPPGWDPTLALTLELAAAEARSELALRGGAPLAPHMAALDELLARPALPAVQRLSARQQLVELQLAADDLPAAADALAASRDELARWDGPRPPLLEAAISEVQASRLARREGADAARLERHLDRLAATWDELLASWERAPVSFGGVGFLHLGGRREVLVELVRVAEAVRGDAGLELALAALSRGQRLGSLALSWHLDAPSLAAVQREVVGPDGLVLLVLPGIRDGHLLVIGEHDLQRLDLPGAPALRALVPRRDGQGGDPEALAAALFPEALRPRLRAASHVSVWGASWLGELDLAALPLGADGRPAGEQLALAELPSLPVGVSLSSGWPAPVEASSSRLSLLVAADPGDAARARWPHLVPLPWTDELAAALGAPFGSDAPAAELDGLNLLVFSSKRERVLHLVGHGFFDPLQPVPAGLALLPRSDDEPELCDAVDVSCSSRLYPPVVLLSVCGAARGPRRLGDDGARHLGGAFIDKGARVVLLADGSLPFGATMELMTALHAGLAAGLSPAQALRDARRATGHGLGLTWFGVAHKPVFLPPSDLVPGWLRPSWWLGTAAVLVLGALLSRRRRRDREATAPR